MQLTPPVDEQERIARMVGRIVDATGELARTTTASEHQRVSRMIGQWDDQIQQTIEELYGLSSEERQAIRS